jgi:hypothetical protein
MPSKTRLANRTIWAVEDIIAASLCARRALDRAIDRSSRQLDPALLYCLLEISTNLASIERLAMDARQGEYHEGTTVPRRQPSP